MSSARQPRQWPRRRPRRWALPAVAGLTLLSAAAPAPAGPASRDPAFGQGDGLVLFDASVREVVEAVLPLDDGRILVVGTDVEGAGVFVARLLADGRPDPSFGRAGGGARFLPLGDPATAADAVLQPDGGVVVAGTVGVTTTDMVVARLTPDGDLDPTFGTGGSVRVDVGRIDQAFDLALHSTDGTVVVVGRGGDEGASAVAARLTPAGDLDPSFNGGVVTTTFEAESAELHAVGLQTSGAVIVGGLTATGGEVQPLVSRLTINGIVDPDYGIGRRADPAALRATSVEALAVDASDRTVVVGPSGAEQSVRSTVSRLTSAGAVDPSFGTGGSTVVSVAVRTVLSAVALDGDGRVVLSGLAHPTGQLPAGFAFGVAARLTGEGLPDPVFGCGGTAVLDVPAEGGGSTLAVATTPAGDLLLGGLAFLDHDVDIPRSDSLVVRLGADAAAGLVVARRDGGVTALGGAPACGSAAGTALNQPVVGVDRTPGGGGYWLVASDGGVFAFGDAGFSGSTGDIALNRPVVGMAADPDGTGYWLVASDGGVFAFDAPYFGSTGDVALNAPVVGMAATETGRGYWLVASDGGVFAFGDAGFSGSTGDIALNRPVVGMAADPDGTGYWLVASDGGVFAFDAPFSGSTGDIALARPVVGLVPDADGGYWLVASDGGVFAFEAPFTGSTTTPPFTAPTVAAAG